MREPVVCEFDTKENLFLKFLIPPLVSTHDIMINIKANVDKKKVKELAKVLRGQQSVFSKLSLQQESIVNASFLVAETIAKKVEAFFRGRVRKGMHCSGC